MVRYSFLHFNLCGLIFYDSLFADTIPDPVEISLEYLAICRDHPGTATLPTIQTHVRHFIEFQWLVPLTPSQKKKNTYLYIPDVVFQSHSRRRSWFPKFRTALADCRTQDEMEFLLRSKVQRWRGRPAIPAEVLDDSGVAEGDGEDHRVVEDLVDLSLLQ